MRIKRYDNAYEFAEAHAQRWLATGVSDGGVMSLSRLAAKGRLDAVICLAILDDQEQVLQTAFIDPTDQICFSRASPAVVALLADYLIENEITFPGIFAPNPSSIQFAEHYTRMGGKAFTIVKQLKHYELTRLRPTELSPGRLRQATQADQALLVTHNIAFQRDANTKRPFDPRESVAAELARGNLYLWESADGSIVSSGRVIPDKTARSGEVSWIFTPRTYRNKGYATSLTYLLSKHILDLGKAACFLSADAADPSSNQVYTKIGYELKSLMDNLRLAEEVAGENC